MGGGVVGEEERREGEGMERMGAGQKCFYNIGSKRVKLHLAW